MFTFLNQVKAELYQVTWPTRKHVIRLTVVVIIISILTGLYLGAVDFIFSKLLQLVIA